MNQLITTTSSVLTIPIPTPKTPITIRPGVMSDVPFMDALQKMHTKQVGWMPTAQFEGKIRLGHVLVAEESGDRSQETVERRAFSASSTGSCLLTTDSRVGYCIGNDRYFKRDDVGIIYQMNVVPGKQRGFIGATLLKAMFDRAAYGCRLFCCWCAQDIEANRFWEACGFVPLAFRGGSEKKGPGGRARVHIFWQKRIRRGDTTTPWWFPCKTESGALRADRLVLPIPHGMHWSDEMPVMVGDGRVSGSGSRVPGEKKKRLSAPSRNPDSGSRNPRKAPVQFGRPGMQISPQVSAQAVTPVKVPRAKPEKVKCDPRLVSAARELRDRWLEQVNDGLLLPLVRMRYDVARDAQPMLAA